MKTYYYNIIYPTPKPVRGAYLQKVEGPCLLVIKDGVSRHFREVPPGAAVHLRWDMEEVPPFRTRTHRRGKRHRMRLPPMELNLE